MYQYIVGKRSDFSLESLCKKHRRVNSRVLGSQEVFVRHRSLEIVKHSIVVLIHLENCHPVRADLLAQMSYKILIIVKL